MCRKANYKKVEGTVAGREKAVSLSLSLSHTHTHTQVSIFLAHLTILYTLHETGNTKTERHSSGGRTSLAPPRPNQLWRTTHIIFLSTDGSTASSKTAEESNWLLTSRLMVFVTFHSLSRKMIKSVTWNRPRQIILTTKHSHAIHFNRLKTKIKYIYYKDWVSTSLPHREHSVFPL
jgi:hypothetical protein